MVQIRTCMPWEQYGNMNANEPLPSFLVLGWVGLLLRPTGLEALVGFHDNETIARDKRLEEYGIVTA